MKSLISNFICFVVGGVAGAACGYFIGKKICEEKANERADEEILNVKERFREELKKAYGIENEETEVEEIPDQNEFFESSSEKNGSFTNYSEMYKEQEEEEEKTDAVVPEEEAHENHQKNKDRPPRIISEESVGELPIYYENRVLYYYTEEELLVDDEEEIISDPMLIVGDCLEKYDFVNSDEEIIFVQNFALDVCYEIQKVEGSYHDTISSE